MKKGKLKWISMISLILALWVSGAAIAQTLPPIADLPIIDDLPPVVVIAPSPIVSAVSPNSGPATGGTRITISGRSFQFERQFITLGNQRIEIIIQPQVRIGDAFAADVVFISETVIEAITPPGSIGFADVTVINPDERSGTLKSGFTYIEMEPPEIMSNQLFPDYNDQNVPVTAGIEIVFSEAISEESVDGGVSIEGKESRHIDFTFRTSKNALILTPAEPFKDEETVTVTVTKAVQDLAGNNLKEDFRASFRTGISVWPGDANNDGQVDVLDILPLGQYWNKTGADRGRTTDKWAIQPAAPWKSDKMATYADTNGDGKVNDEDILPIALNWRLSHSSNQFAPSRIVVPVSRELLDVYEALYNALETAPFENEGVRTLRDFLRNTLTKQSNPHKNKLLQNFPNPFNPETWIPYQLDRDVFVIIRIYNSAGRLIRTLDLGRKDAGVYAFQSRAAYWDGRNEAGEEVASGIYFYCITAGDFSAVTKMAAKM